MRECMLVSTIPLTSTSSCSSVRDMWNLSCICRTVDGPWPKHGSREPAHTQTHTHKHTHKHTHTQRTHIHRMGDWTICTTIHVHVYTLHMCSLMMSTLNIIYITLFTEKTCVLITYYIMFMYMLHVHCILPTHQI